MGTCGIGIDGMLVGYNAFDRFGGDGSDKSVVLWFLVAVCSWWGLVAASGYSRCQSAEGQCSGELWLWCTSGLWTARISAPGRDRLWAAAVWSAVWTTGGPTVSSGSTLWARGSTAVSACRASAICSLSCPGGTLWASGGSTVSASAAVWATASSTVSLSIRVMRGHVCDE